MVHGIKELLSSLTNKSDYRDPHSDRKEWHPSVVLWPTQSQSGDLRTHTQTLTLWQTHIFHKLICVCILSPTYKYSFTHIHTHGLAHKNACIDTNIHTLTCVCTNTLNVKIIFFEEIACKYLEAVVFSLCAPSFSSSKVSNVLPARMLWLAPALLYQSLQIVSSTPESKIFHYFY